MFTINGHQPIFKLVGILLFMSSIMLEIKNMVSDAIGFDGLVVLMTSVLILLVYLSVAYHSSKLMKYTQIPGVKIIAYSFWFLVWIWVPVSFVWFIETELDESFIPWNFLTIATTLPLLTAAIGYRTMVRALLSKSELTGDLV